MSNKNKNDQRTDVTNNTVVDTEADGRLTRDELAELLRYFVGNPMPYMQDGRYRDLLATFQATDDRPYSPDSRTAPVVTDANEG